MLEPEPEPEPRARRRLAAAEARARSDLLLERTRAALAGSVNRVDGALAQSREAMGSSASVEGAWQAYRSKHDALGESLESFGRSFSRGTWEAMASSAGGVMAELMAAVELPEPSVRLGPGNTAQLLSEHVRQRKQAVQARWGGPEVSVAEGYAVPLEEWRAQLALLAQGSQPQASRSLEEFVVDAGDPRLGLVGQRGVRVREGCAVAAQTVLLHYAGAVRTQEEFDERYSVEESSEQQSAVPAFIRHAVV